MIDSKLLHKYTDSNYLSFKEFQKIIRYKNCEEFKDVVIEEFWEKLVSIRKEKARSTTFVDINESLLFFNITEETQQYIDKIEEAGRDKIDQIIPEEIKDDALIDSLIDEAFSSSVIEGAYSTRKRAHDMISKNQTPRNKSEKMILNNYQALEFSLDKIDEDLTHETIHRIWEILTEETLEEEDICDGYRTGDVFVVDKRGKTVFEGPSADKINIMMEELIQYFNSYDKTNPIVKACLIHYYFVYIHPFFDGNGRTARALMHMYLIRNGYEFLKYFSISKILVDKRIKYYEVIRTSEIHESDVTYFIDFYTKLLIDTIHEIRNSYLYQFSKRIILELMDKNNIIFNERQKKALNYFLKRSKSSIDIKEYTRKYKVTTETARKDLQLMVDLGYFKKIKSGKKFLYNFNDLQLIISRLKNM